MSDFPTARRVPRAASATPILERIERLQAGLRPSEQAVARFVLRRPHLVVGLSFPDIAARAGVSQPTVARFCRALGFSGYRDFKLRLAQGLASGMPYVHAAVSAGDSSAEVGPKVLDREIAALVALRSQLDSAALERATALLAAARRVEFYGLGNSGIVAQDAQHKFFRLGAPAVAYADPHVQAMAAALLGGGDVVVAISGTGRTREILRSVEIARAAGADVVAITAGGSPLAQRAHVALAADAPEDLDVYAPMSSRLVHLALVDVLAVGVALARGPALVRRLKRAKEAIAERRTEG